MDTRFPDLTDLLYQQNLDRINDNYENIERFQDKYENDRSTSVSLEEEDSSPFGVDLSGKSATSLGGKSFTIAAILGLTSSEKDVMNLSVQERLQQNQKHFENYLYSGHDVQRINDGFCRVAVPLRRDNSRGELRPQAVAASQTKAARAHPASCSNVSGRSKRIRTIFTPEQLERLEAEFERQQYMVGPERLYLAHALQLTEAQVKVWFQNRRIKWRKHHLEVTQQRLAVLQRHRPDADDVM